MRRERRRGWYAWAGALPPDHTRGKSGLRDLDRADHDRATYRVHESERVEHERTEVEGAQPHVLQHVTRSERDAENEDEREARRDRRSLVVLHLPALVGERRRRHVV